MNLTEMQYILLTKLFEKTMELVENEGADSSVHLLRDVCAVFAASLRKIESGDN